MGVGVTTTSSPSATGVDPLVPDPFAPGPFDPLLPGAPETAEGADVGEGGVRPLIPGAAEGLAEGEGEGVADTVSLRLLRPAMAVELLVSSRSRMVL